MSEDKPWEISVIIRRTDAAHPPLGTPWHFHSVVYSYTMQGPDGTTREGVGNKGKLSEAIGAVKAWLAQWDGDGESHPNSEGSADA